ncbi:MAG: hypothetical protein IKW49_01785 [Opitutales bacterium]|nr:hypothetical protein [Opitutales bacterium]
MSETYQKHIVSVNGSGTVSIPFEWSDPSEVYVYCYGSVGPYTGTLAGMIANGWVSLLGAAGGDVLTHFQAGQRVWMVLSRQTALDSYSSLRDLLKAIDELRAEIQCTFRVPDVFLPVLAAFPATERKGKALVFDDNGNPALGDVAGGDVKTARDETLQAASDVKARAEQTAESVEDAKQWALKSADAYSRLVSAADAILKATDDAVVGCKQEIQRLLNNADVAGSEKLRELQVRFEQYVATLGQAVSSASAQWDALLSGAMTSISEARETSVLNVENSRESALNAMGVELNHSLRVIRECVEAYGLELKNQTKTMLDELREVYSQEWADSAKQWATKFSDLEKSIENRLQWSDVRSGIQTQSILGWDEISNKATSNAMYLDGVGIRAISQGADVLFPVKGGTLALLSDVDEKLGDISSDTFALRENGTIKSPTILEGKASSLCSIPVAEVPENADNASYDAFLGTLNSVGIVGESIIPTTLSFYRRNANGYVDTDVPRFLQIRRRDANGNWYIAYNSWNGLAPNSFLLAGDEMKWILFEVAGGPIPDDEVISITETDDEAGTNLVSWGAKATRIYGGGIASGAEIIESNRASHAPLLKMDFYLLSDIATKGDVEAVELLKADLVHFHDISDVTNLQTQLDSKAPKTALSNYLPFAGGTLSGDLTIVTGSGGLRMPNGASIFAPNAGIYPITVDLGGSVKLAGNMLELPNSDGSNIGIYFNYDPSTTSGDGRINVSFFGYKGGSIFPDMTYKFRDALGGDTTVATLGDLSDYAKYGTTGDETDISFGQRSSAKGGSSVAIGTAAKALDSGAVAFGSAAEGEGSYSTALGGASYAAGESSVAVGDSACASSNFTVTAGYCANVDEPAEGAIAIGAESSASNILGVAMGYSSFTEGGASISIGSNSYSSGSSAIALGYKASADDTNAISIGTQSHASARCNISIGHDSRADASESIAVGLSAKSLGDNSCAFGAISCASAHYSCSIGRVSYAGGSYGVSVGYAAASGSEGSTALGAFSVANGVCSTAVGYGATACESAQVFGAFGRNANPGTTVISAISDAYCCSVSSIVQLYLITAGSDLSKQYCGGEAGLGFIETSAAGLSGEPEIIHSGTKKLSDIFTDNKDTFSPQMEAVISCGSPCC